MGFMDRLARMFGRILEAAKYSLGALTNRELYSDYVKLGGAQAVIALAIFLVTILLGVDSSLFQSTGLYGQDAMAGAAVGNVLLFVAIFYTLTLLQGFISAFFQGKFIKNTLAREGLSSSAAYSFKTFLKFVLTSVTSSLHTLFFWRNKKWLSLYLVVAIGVAMLSFGAAGQFTALTILGLLVMLVGAVALFAMWVYTGFRLCLMHEVMLSNPDMSSAPNAQGKGVLSRIWNYMGYCSRSSWGISEGKALRIFAYEIFMVALVLLFMAPFIVVGWIGSTILMFVSSGAGRLFDGILQAIYLPFVIAFGAYYMVYIYRELLNEKNGVKATNSAMKQPSVAQQSAPKSQMATTAASAAMAQPKAKSTGMQNKPAAKTRAKKK